MNKQNLKFPPNPSLQNIDNILQEVIVENTNTSFPIRIHYTAHDQHQQYFIHKHWHKDLEILYVTEGQMEVTVDEHSFSAQKGDILFIPTGALHAAINTFNTSCTFYAIVFEISFISSVNPDQIQQKYLNPLTSSPEQHIYFIKNDNPINTQFSNLLDPLIEQYGQKDIGYELVIKANLLLFFNLLFRNKETFQNYESNKSIRSNINSYTCKQILLYIEENYGSKITLEEISQFIGFSKEHFCRFFKKNFDVSFFTYLAYQRIKKAQDLLLYTEKKIIDIAIETGFEDANYFTTVFKKETGVTPSAYRKNHQQ